MVINPDLYVVESWSDHSCVYAYDVGTDGPDMRHSCTTISVICVHWYRSVGGGVHFLFPDYIFWIRRIKQQTPIRLPKITEQDITHATTLRSNLVSELFVYRRV